MTARHARRCRHSTSRTPGSIHRGASTDRFRRVGDAVPERSLTHPDFELADLFGSGLPDVVQIGDARRYWKNLGKAASMCRAS